MWIPSYTLLCLSENPNIRGDPERRVKCGAERIITENGAAAESLAAALLKHGKHDGDQASAIIEAALREQAA